MAKLSLRTSETSPPVEVEVHRDCAGHLSCRIGDAHLEARHEERPGGGILHIQGKVHPYYAVRKDRHLELWMAGETYVLELVSNHTRRARPTAGPVFEEITAPMPGTILKIYVGPGDAFEAHEPLIIMESMKMELTLSAPHAGKVTEVTCGVGDLVPMGKTLARLKPVEAHAELPR